MNAQLSNLSAGPFKKTFLCRNDMAGSSKGSSRFLLLLPLWNMLVGFIESKHSQPSCKYEDWWLQYINMKLIHLRKNPKGIGGGCRYWGKFLKERPKIMPPSILAVYIYDIQARVHCRLLKSSTSIFNAWRGVVKCTKGRKNKKYFFCTGHLQSSRTFFPDCTGYEWRSGKGSQ